MKHKEPIELFMPPNMLKAKAAGGGTSGLDMAAIKRAEQAMETLKSEFADWLADDVAALVAARSRYGRQADAGRANALACDRARQSRNSSYRRRESFNRTWLERGLGPWRA